MPNAAAALNSRGVVTDRDPTVLLVGDHEDGSRPPALPPKRFAASKAKLQLRQSAARPSGGSGHGEGGNRTMMTVASRTMSAWSALMARSPVAV